jgi:hypothetical protein
LLDDAASQIVPTSIPPRVLEMSVPVRPGKSRQDASDRALRAEWEARGEHE